MKDQETIIDLKFGLSQLSGNQDLLVKLLTKFHAQYDDLADKLDALFAKDDVVEATGIIHTVKGVTGNLGITALHNAAKNFESSLTMESDRREALVEFKFVLSKTLIEIETISQKSSPAVPLNKGGLSELKDSLQRQEYISEDKLDGYLSNSNLTESSISLITQAIDELDYPKALILLENN